MDDINNMPSLEVPEEINDSENEFEFEYKRNNISLDEISIEEMGNIKNTDEFAHLKDISTILNIVKRRNNGEVFDVYEGEHVSKNEKSVALSITFQSDSHTLKDEEINQVFEAILEHIQKDCNATLRS